MPHQNKRAPLRVWGTNLAVPGLHARCVVKVKTGGRTMRDCWFRLGQALGLACAVLEGGRQENGVWYYETTYDVWGTPAALTALVNSPNKCLISIEHALTPTRVINCQGSGPEKQRPAKPKPKPPQGPAYDHPDEPLFAARRAEYSADYDKATTAK